MTKALIASVTLQRLNDRKHYEEIGRVEIDATALLALPASELKEVIEDFDEDRAPYIERLPLPEAQALSVAHGGPSEVYLGVVDFLSDLGLVPDDAEVLDWLTDDILRQARNQSGFVTRDPSTDEGRVFEIGGSYVAVALEDSGWSHRGSFDTRDKAETAASAGSAPTP